MSKQENYQGTHFSKSVYLYMIFLLKMLSNYLSATVEKLQVVRLTVNRYFYGFSHVNSAYVAPQISAENMEMIPQFHFPRLLVALLPHVHPQFCITSVHGHTHKGQLASVHHPTGTELDGFSSWNSAAVDVGLKLRLDCTTCGTDCMQDRILYMLKQLLK